MNIFVGAEHVIASALIVLNQSGIDWAAFSAIRDLGWNIQRRCNEAGIDAIIFVSGRDIMAAAYDFSDYFACENASKPIILMKKCVSTKDLQKRFILRLPKEVKEVIQEETNAYLRGIGGCEK